MKELRFVRKDEIIVYDDTTAQHLYNIRHSGIFRKRYHLLDPDGIPLAYMQRNLFGTRWKIVDIDNEETAIIRRRLFTSNFKLVVDGSENYLDDEVHLQFMNTKSLAVILKIGSRVMKSKDTVIVENSGYLKDELASLVSLLVIMRYKLI